MSTHNTHYASRKKKVHQPQNSFFRRFRLEVKFYCDSWHKGKFSKVVEIPRSLVPVSIDNVSIRSPRSFLSDYLLTSLAGYIYFIDKSVTDFDFCSCVFDHSSCTSAQALLSGLLFRGSVQGWNFTFSDVDRGCDSVSFGVLEYKVYIVEG